MLNYTLGKVGCVIPRSSPLAADAWSRNLYIKHRTFFGQLLSVIYYPGSVRRLTKWGFRSKTHHRRNPRNPWRFRAHWQNQSDGRLRTTYSVEQSRCVTCCVTQARSLVGVTQPLPTQILSTSIPLNHEVRIVSVPDRSLGTIRRIVVSHEILLLTPKDRD